MHCIKLKKIFNCHKRFILKIIQNLILSKREVLSIILLAALCKSVLTPQLIIFSLRIESSVFPKAGSACYSNYVEIKWLGSFDWVNRWILPWMAVDISTTIFTLKIRISVSPEIGPTCESKNFSIKRGLSFMLLSEFHIRVRRRSKNYFLRVNGPFDSSDIGPTLEPHNY